MINKKKSLHQLALFIPFFLAITFSTKGQVSLLNGTIQFDKHAQLIDINAYYYGKKLLLQEHNFIAPKITYEITKSKDQNIFYLLVCPTAPTYRLKKFPQQDDMQNTIEELKLDSDTPYLLYKLHFITSLTETGNDSHWEISTELLPESGAIPENTIIMIYFPHLIKALSGGNQLELPTLFLENIVDKENGLELLSADEEIIKLQLSSLDLSALHAPTKKKVKSDKRRVLVMETIA